VGNCAVIGEQNDATALAAQVGVSEPMGEAGTSNDAIEPISQGRLNLYKGVNNTGVSGGIGGYFLDPSCPYNASVAACGTGTGASYIPNSINPAVTPITTGSPGDGGTLFNPTITLYTYFRDADITSATPFQPGTTLNWVKALFYNPCPPGGVGCSTDSNGYSYGPGGAPYIDGAGATALQDAGVTPVNTSATGSFTSDGP